MTTVATRVGVQSVSWAEFQRKYFRWQQGEHLAAVAPTGAGKTTLFESLMSYRRCSIMFGTKPADKMYNRIIRNHGFKVIGSVKEIKPWDEKVLLWPGRTGSIPQRVTAQRDAFREAMDMIVSQQAWTVWVDECKYISEFLKLRTELTYCLEQLRSIEATVISGAQRPTHLPLSVLANSSHVFLWKSNNRDDARKLADVGGIDARQLTEEMKSLDEHEFIYVRTRGTSASVVRSQVGK